MKLIKAVVLWSMMRRPWHPRNPAATGRTGRVTRASNTRKVKP